MSKITITQSIIDKARRDARPGQPRYEIRDARSAGLILRVGPTGAGWQFRFGVSSRDLRLSLGSIDTWTLTEARKIVAAGRAMLDDRTGIPDDVWIERWLVREGKAAASTMAPAPAKPREIFLWTLAQARTAYLDDRASSLRPVTVADYRAKLTVPEIAKHDKSPVARLTRQDMAAAVAAIHRSGRETHAANVVRAITAFWSWLERDEWIGKSGVTAGVMRGLQAPDRTLDEDDDELAYVPELAEIGRVIAIARSGALHDTIGSAVELMCWTVQRRRTIAEARPADFQPVGDGTEGLWIIPPKSLKKRLKNGRKRRPHVIPLPAPVWAKILEQLARIPRDAVWMFPQIRARRAGDEMGHVDSNTLSHTLQFMPGIQATPHALRRAFATHGESRLGLLRPDTKSILDHADGAGDVTGGHYALHDKTHRTWPIMRIWVEALQPEIEKAAAALEPVEQIKTAMAAAKRGDDEGLKIAAE